MQPIYLGTKEIYDILKHAAYCPFQSPQIAIYFIILPASIQIILTFS
jgi:hypothetical protein